MAREFLMLAEDYIQRKHSIAGWFLSEKLDGMRAFWDGGITRGIPASMVPFANIAKDSRYKQPPVATGLWSRYGKVIHAPDWWLDALPPVLLDGELYGGRGTFQSTMSTVKHLTPGKEWIAVSFNVIDTPNPNVIFSNGNINNINFKKMFKGIDLWYKERVKFSPFASNTFEINFAWLDFLLKGNKVARLHSQERLPYSTKDAQELIERRLLEVTDGGGEGLMIRRPSSIWMPERSHDLLKVKKLKDAEGTVIGYKWGEETDKGSKLLGLMGSLSLRLESGVVFDLSGFNEPERQMSWLNGEDASSYGEERPGEVVSYEIENKRFPRGSVVTFAYRELTDRGVPKEARFIRRLS